MLIGKLAGAAGVNIQTIRFYEREGLLRPPQRSHAGYRNYEAGDLE
ncbi:MAG TPA: MerR family DNA-binding transcriptional regulator, partial [Candidatus Binatia bacterium]|nr:MerR family DNA-binding transcriptional regulator [Candidatus Binatia bacterium]